MSTIAMPEPDQECLARRQEILAALEKVAPGVVISDPAETLAYECDALTAYRCPPLAVTLPRTTQEVAAIMATCNRLGVPVVPRGAGTSLAGGSLPTADSVILGTAPLNQVLDIDVSHPDWGDQFRKSIVIMWIFPTRCAPEWRYVLHQIETTQHLGLLCH